MILIYVYVYMYVHAELKNIFQFLKVEFEKEKGKRSDRKVGFGNMKRAAFGFEGFSIKITRSVK